MNGDWLREDIMAIRRTVEDIAERLAAHEGAHAAGSTTLSRMLTLGGILVALGIGLAGLFVR